MEDILTRLYVQLDLIDDNPYQDRGAYEDIAELGRSIAMNDLEQCPKARRVGERYQLKFGHRRKRAFDWLRENWQKENLQMRYSGYTVMPLDVVSFSENEMFDGVVIENVHRDDLKVTEKSRLLRRYKEMHPDATSKQIGLVFNMNEATVRGMDIFLDPPAEVQAKLDDGTISQGTARQLHSMGKVAPKEKIVEAVKEIAKKNGQVTPETIIEQKIRHLNNVEQMWYGDGKPRAGRHGWDLDMKKFPNHLLPAMTVQQVAAYEAQIDHLTNPPACTACPYYTKVRGSHFCGMKFCFERKSIAYQDHATEQASQKTKIKVYEENDGGFRALVGWEDSHKKLFESRDEGLRLIPARMLKSSVYQGFGKLDDVVVVVATGKSIDKLSSGRGGAAGGKKPEKEKAEMRALKIYRIRRKELLWEFTLHAKSIFDAVPFDVLERINEWRYAGVDQRPPAEEPSEDDKKALGEYLRRYLVWKIVEEQSSGFRREKLSDIFSDLEERAKLWKIKIPAALRKSTETWDTEIKEASAVSTATPKKG